MHMPSPHRLKRLIEEAMQVRAPKMYARLKKAGALEAELDDREGVAREAFQMAIGRQGSPYLRARRWGRHRSDGSDQQALSAAAEQAIAIATEFEPEEPASEESEDPSRSLPRE